MDYDELTFQCSTETWSRHPRPTGGMIAVGTGPNGVKITHKPTGICACIDTARSQHLNRIIALDMILSAITHPRNMP